MWIHRIKRPQLEVLPFDILTQRVTCQWEEADIRRFAFLGREFTTDGFSTEADAQDMA